MMEHGVPGKVVCVGRNYADHIAELHNQRPQRPLLFIKPSTAVTQLPTVLIPAGQGECQHEVEIALLLGHTLRRADVASAMAAVSGYGLALDLTLRELQTQLKQQGQPWERAKAFDHSCALSSWIPATEIARDVPLTFELTINGQIRQQGSSVDMLFSMAELLSEISQHFTLQPGDVVLTGTPAGVGPLQAGDQLTLSMSQLQQQWQWQGQVAIDE